ncbi:hypothetical protein GCM10023080_033140 [Streptomyces pseudoechinosporeus]
MTYSVNDDARPQLKALDVLVGTWKLSGDAEGETTYSWMRGGHFLIQRASLTQGGETHHVTEVIGYEKPFMAEQAAETISSRAYTDSGDTLDYTWELQGEVLTIWGGQKGSPAFARATFSADHNTLTGAWQWPGGGYEFSATRVASRASS